jgi:hypothetical protein
LWLPDGEVAALFGAPIDIFLFMDVNHPGTREGKRGGSVMLPVESASNVPSGLIQQYHSQLTTTTAGCKAIVITEAKLGR